MCEVRGDEDNKQPRKQLQQNLSRVTAVTYRKEELLIIPHNLIFKSTFHKEQKGGKKKKNKKNTVVLIFLFTSDFVLSINQLDFPF